MRSHLSIIDVIAQAIGILFRNLSPVPISLRIFSTFSSRSFSGSGFMWSSLIHLDLSYVQGDKNGSICILLNDYLPIVPAPFLENAFFPMDGFSSLVKVSDHRCVSSLLGLQFYFIDLPVCCSTSTMQILSEFLCSTG